MTPSFLSPSLRNRNLRRPCANSLGLEGYCRLAECGRRGRKLSNSSVRRMGSNQPHREGKRA
jgi:hypothetical protein